MRFDAQALFERLTEREKIKGHHSPEGSAIRTLSRALNGWSTGNLGAVDVLALCAQAMEDWVKARLKVPQWSPLSLPALLEKAVEANLLTRSEAVRLKQTHAPQARGRQTRMAPTAEHVESALELCIRVVEKHW